MEIKYEAVFGDQSLFEGFDNETIAVCYNSSLDVYSKLLQVAVDARGSTELRANPIVAMRRIIADPNRWTAEDQKAGRLPEVGCKVDFCHKLNTNWRTGEIKYIDNQVAVIKADNIDRPFVYEFDRVEFKPIETPAQKAQREEDEFVASVIDLASENQLMSCGFKDGVIAAYRKLKGGK